MQIETVKKMKKIRADVLLCERGHFETPDEAARFIMAGKVRLNADMLLRKPSELVDPEAPLLVDSGLEYVSRGAFKLLEALKKHLPDLNGKICLDIGSSTGGFTDVMLRHGADKVYSTDVGKGLLHGKLRNDPRVVVREGINIKELTKEQIPDEIDVATADVSFISVTKALGPANELMRHGATAFILVKPQFEAPKHEVPPGGVVTDENVRAAMVEKVKNFAQKQLNWACVDVMPSPIKGPKGNQEYVAVFRKP